MRDHVKLLGIFNIVLGGVSAAFGLAMLLITGGVTGFLAYVLRSEGDSSAWLAPPIVAAAGTAIALFLVCLGLPAIIGGFGLLNFRPWARILVVILSILHLFHFPFGTALGVYGLWVLLSEDGQRLFEPRLQDRPLGQISRPA